MKETYHQTFPRTIIIIATASFILSLKLFSLYGNSGSLIELISANILLFIFIACSKPIIEWRRIEIDSGHITIFKRFFKPLRIDISESLYQIVMQDNKIRSFRFRYGRYYTQVSPMIYKNGDKMAETLTDYIKKHNLSIEIFDQ